VGESGIITTQVGKHKRSAVQLSDRKLMQLHSKNVFDPTGRVEDKQHKDNLRPCRLGSVSLHVIIVIIIITVLVSIFTTSHRTFRNLIKTLGRSLLDESSAHRKGLYLYRTT
jgi:hypothetical protein